MMKCLVSQGPNKIAIVEKPIPHASYGEAVVKMTTTTICGTDVHILKGEYPVANNLTVGHELVGVISEIGPGVTGYTLGERVLVPAITPCFQCEPCLNGISSQCACGGKVMGGWRFGNFIDGCQAEYILVPAAQANLTKIPASLTDDDVILCSDIMSTGFGGAEAGDVKIGDAVAIFAVGPIGMCAVTGAKLMGAAIIIAVDCVDYRLELAKKLGATHTVNFKTENVVEAIMNITGQRGVDVSIECLGLQTTFENCLRCLKPGGTLSSLGVYSGHLQIPLDAFAAGLSNQRITTNLCPGGKERMRRLMAVIEQGRVDLKPLITHHFKFDQILEAYDLFSHQRDGVLKVSITP